MMAVSPVWCTKSISFHTPYDMTVFATEIAKKIAAKVANAFPYALWRDRVCNPTRLCEAVTSADTGRLHRCHPRGVEHVPENQPKRLSVLVKGLHG